MYSGDCVKTRSSTTGAANGRTILDSASYGFAGSTTAIFTKGCGTIMHAATPNDRCAIWLCMLKVKTVLKPKISEL